MSRRSKVKPEKQSAVSAQIKLRPVPRLQPLAACVRYACLPAGLVLSLGLNPVMAGPQDGQVVGGQGNISNPDANTTNIHQQSHNLAIDWQSFNVGKNEAVNFHQPSKNATALNRIFDQNPSQIFGRINANGNVILANPNGLMFGPSAQVNVNSLIGAGHDISVQDFMNGQWQFKTPEGTEAGQVINHGLLQAATGGSINLIGGSVRNEGTILATAGQVNMAAGEQITMDFDGDGLMQFTVDKEVLSNAHGLDGAVVNTGEISANGGYVTLSGKVAQNVFSHVVNNEGVIRATRIENQGGKIVLGGSGGSQSSVINTGVVDASAGDATSDGGSVEIAADTIEQQGTIRADSTGGDGGTIKLVAEDTNIVSGDAVISAKSVAATDSNEAGQGGTVHVLGDKVALLDNSLIDVSGELGGGQVLVGGGFQGANPEIQNASMTYVDQNTTIKADAITNGDGGEVIVWADEWTKFYGNISARGGSEGGDGGFVEVSGKQHLTYAGIVDLRAPFGSTGTLLLDPTNIWIANNAASAVGAGMPDNDPPNNDVDDSASAGAGNPFEASGPVLDSLLTVSVLQDALALANVEVTTANVDPGATADGDINVVDVVTWSSGNLLTLTADNNININAGITSTGAGGGLTLGAANNINIDASINLAAGNLTATAVAGDIVTSASITLANGDISMTTGNDLTVGGAIELGRGNAFFEAGQDLAFNADVTSLAPGRSIDARAGQHLTVNAALATAGTGPGGSGSAIRLEADSPDLSGNGTGTLTVTGAGSVSSNGGPVTLIGADFAVGASVNAGGGNINLMQSENAALNLNTGAGEHITQASLNNLNTSGDGALILGRATSFGGTTLQADSIEISGVSLGARNVTLRSLGDITSSGATGITLTTGLLTLDTNVDGTGTGEITGDVGGPTPFEMDVQHLAVNTRNDFYINNANTLQSLDIQTDGGAATQTLASTGLTYTVADVASNTVITEITQASALDLTYRNTVGDLVLATGAINTVSGDVNLRANGSIVHDSTAASAVITTSGQVSLTADTGFIGETGNDTIFIADSTNLVIDSREDVYVEAFAALTHLDLTVNPAGGPYTYSIIDDGGAGGLQAVSVVDAGADLRIDDLESNNNLNLRVTTRTGDLLVANNAIDVGAGPVFLRALNGSVLASGVGGNNITTTGQVQLVAGSGAIGTGTAVDDRIDIIGSDNLILDATGSIFVETDTALSRLEMIVSTSGGDTYSVVDGGSLTTLGLTEAGGHARLDGYQSSGMDYLLRNRSGDIVLADDVGVNADAGAVTLRASGSILGEAGTGNHIATTGNVSLRADSGSVGAPGDPIRLTGNGNGTFIANNGGLHLHNTNAGNIGFGAGSELDATVGEGVFGFGVSGLGSLQYDTTQDLSITATDGSITTDPGATMLADNLVLNTVGAGGVIDVDTDVNSATVTGTVGNDVTINDAGTTNTVYSVETGGAGDIVVTQAANDLLVEFFETTGAVTLEASDGNILDHTDDLTVDIIAGGLITLNAPNGFIGADPATTDDVGLLELCDGCLVTANAEGGVNLYTPNGELIVAAPGGVTSAGGEDINLFGDDGVTVNGDVSSNGGDITVNGDFDASGAGTVAINADIDADTGDITIIGAPTTVGAGGSLTTTGDATIMSSTAGGTFALGDTAITACVTCDNELTDAMMDSLIVGGVLTIGDATAGDVTLHRDTPVFGGGADNLVIVTGGIIDDANDGTLAFQTTGSLTLTSGGAIGANSGGANNALTIDVGTLEIRDTGDNAVSIHDTGATDTVYDIGIDAALGAVTITQAASDILLDRINAGGNDVSLTADNGSILNNRGDTDTLIFANALTLAANEDIGNLGDTGSVLEGPSGAGQNLIRTEVSSLSATTTAADSHIHIRNTGGALDITGLEAGVGEIGHALVTNAGNDLDLTGITISAGDHIGLLVTGSGNLTVPDMDFDMGATGQLRLEAVGNVTRTGGGNLDVSGNWFRLVSNNAQTLATDVANLEVDITGAGNLVVNEASAIHLRDLSTFNGNITVTNTTGDMTVTDVAANGDVDLTATAGSILSSSSDISGNTVTLTADSGIGTSADEINTDADNLNLEVVNAGNMFVVNDGSVTINSAVTNNGTILLSAINGGDMNLADTAGGAVQSTNNQTVVLDASGNLTGLNTTGVDIASTGMIDLTGASISGQRGADSNALEVSAGATVAATSASTVHIFSAGDINLNNFLVTNSIFIESGGALVFGSDRLNASNGSINLVANGDIGAIGGDAILVRNAPNGVNAESTTGNIHLASDGSDLNVGVIESVAGAVTLVSDNDIIDANNNTNVNVTADGLITLQATSGDIGATGNGRIDLAAGSTVVAETTTGDIFLRGVGALTLGNGTDGIETTTGAIDVLAVNAIDVNSDGVVSGSGTVSLESTAAGDITLANDAIRTGNTGVAAVYVRNQSGDILDGDTATLDDVSVDADAPGNIFVREGATVTLIADNGSIGDFPGAPGDAHNPDNGDIDIVVVDAGGVPIIAGGNISLDLQASQDVYVETNAAVLDSANFVVTPSNTTYSLKTSASTISFGDDNTDFTIAEISNAGVLMNVSFTSTSGNIFLADTPGGAIQAIGDGNVVLTAQSGAIIGQNTGGLDIASAGNITLSATGNIVGASGAGTDSLGLAAGATVNAESTGTGNIRVIGAGELTLNDIETNNGLVAVFADGTIHVGIIDSSSTVTLESDNGDILDATDDTVVDITAGGTITLTAAGRIGGPAAAADDYLELAAGSTVVASSGNGDLKLRGLGGLTLQDIEATGGEIDVTAAGLLTATDVSTVGNENITLATTAGGIDVSLVDAGAGDVAISANGALNGLSNDSIADIVGGTVTLSAGAAGIGTTTIIDVTAADSLNASTAGNGNILIDSIGDLPVGLINAGTGTVTLTSTGAINDDTANPDTTTDIIAGTLNLTAATGIGNTAHLDLNVDTLVGTTTNGDIAINNIGDLDADLTATNGAITLINSGDLAGDFDANNDLNLTAASIGTSVTPIDVAVGGTLTLTSTGTGAANAGDIHVDATGALTLGTVTVTDTDDDQVVSITGNDAVTLAGQTDLTGNVSLTLEAGAPHDLRIENALTAGDITLTAGNDVVVTIDNVDGSNNQDVTVLTGTLTVNAGNDLRLEDAAGPDTRSRLVALAGGTDIELNLGNALDIETNDTTAAPQILTNGPLVFNVNGDVDIGDIVTAGFLLDNGTLSQIDAGVLEVNTTTGDISLSGTTDADTNSIGTIELNADQDVLIATDNSAVVNGSLNATGATGIAVNGDLTSNTGNIDLTATTNDIDFANGVTVAAGDSLTLSAGNALVGAGALTLNAADGVSINSDLTTGNLAATGNLIINADTDNNGTGTFEVADGATVATTGGTADGTLAITAADLDLNTTGALNSGTATTTITASDDGGIGLGSAGGDLTVTDAQLGNITATGLEFITTGGGAIVVNETTTGNTGGFGTLTLTSASTVTFGAGGSVFENALDATGATGIAVNGDLTSNTGNIDLTATTNDIDFADGVTVAAGDSLTLSAGNALVGAGALTLNAADGVSINSDLTTGNLAATGNLIINADTDNNGTGTFEVADGATVATTGGTADGTLAITAADLDLNTTGALNSGTATTTITASNNGDINLGNEFFVGEFTISDAELNQITAASMSVTTTGVGQISLAGTTAGNTAGFGDLTLVGNGGVTIGSGGSAAALTNGLEITGDTTIEGDLSTVNSNIDFNSPVTIAADVMISTDTGAGNVSFAGTVDSSVGETNDLTLTAGTGNVTFDGLVGDSDALGDLVVNSTGTTRFNGTVEAGTLLTNAGGTTELNGDVTTVGTQTYGNDVLIDDDIVLTTTNSAVSFAGTVDSSVGETNDLTLTAGTGNVTFAGLVGDTDTLGAILVTSAGGVTGNGIRAASFTQTTGTGTTTLNAGTFTDTTTEALNTTGLIDITNEVVAVNGLVTSGDSVDMEATNGTLALAAGAHVTGGDDIALTATGNITLDGDVTAAGSAVAIDSSGGSISGAGLVTGDTVSLDSDTGIGTGTGDRINTAAGTLAARSSTSGGVFLNQTGDVTLDTVNGVVNDAFAAYDLIGSGSIDVDADITAGTTLDLVAAQDITLGTVTLTSSGNMSLRVDSGNAVAAILDLGAATLNAGVNMIQLSGGTGADLDTLIAQDLANIWVITAQNEGTLNNASISNPAEFTNFANLMGAATQNDSFAFDDNTSGSAITGTIDGLGGDNTLDWSIYDAAITVQLSGTGTNGFDGSASNVNAFENINELTGDAGHSNTLEGADIDAIWNVTGGQSGTYSDDPVTQTLTWTNFNDLTGNDQGDTFNLTASHTGDLRGGDGNDEFNFESTDPDNFVLTGNVFGGAGDDAFNFIGTGGTDGTYTIDGSLDGGTGNDTIDFSDSELIQRVTFTGSGSDNGQAGTILDDPNFDDTDPPFFAQDLDLISGSFDNINSIIGNDRGTLIGQNADTFWVITTANQGHFTTTNLDDAINNVGTTTFSNFSILGGNQQDVFIFQTGGSIDFGIDGGVNIDIGAGLKQNFLLGSTDADIFNITGSDTVDIQVGGVGSLTSLENIHNIDASFTDGITTFDGGGNTFNVDSTWDGSLRGGTGADSFFLDDAVTVTGGIDGGTGAGNDTIDWAAYGSPVAVTLNALGDDNGFEGTGAGTSFDNINAVVASTTDGGTLTGIDDDATWAITGADSGTYTSTNALAFTDFDNLTGGSDEDQFTLSGGTVTGTIDGGGGDDTLTADNVANTWNITGNNAGDATGVNAFTSIENLVGGSDTDNFVFSNGFGVSGSVDGGDGSDTLNFTAYNTTVDVTLTNVGNTDGFMGNTSGTPNPIGNGFDNIHVITGANATNTLTGRDGAPADWTTTGAGAGTYVSGGRTLTFSSFDNWTGGDGVDTFTLNAGHDLGTVSGGQGNDEFNINGSLAADLLGGDGDDEFVFTNGAVLTGTIAGGAGSDTLDLSAYTTVTDVTLTVSAADGYSGTIAGAPNPVSGGFSTINVLTGGGATNELTGLNAAATWTTTGVNAGTYLSGGNTLTFSNFADWTGGSAVDTFELNAGHNLGTVSGAGGDDVFNVNGSLTANLNGDAGDDSFVFANGAQLTGNIAGGTGSDTLDASAYTSFVLFNLNSAGASGANGNAGVLITAPNGFTNIDVFEGGSAGDQFNINASVTADLSGNGGNDNFDFASGVVLTGDIDGGMGSDTLDWSSYGAGNAITATLTDQGSVDGFQGTATGITGGSFDNIDDIVGEGGEVNTLQSDIAGAATWTITANSEGTYQNGNTLSFEDFSNLSGGGGVDTFDVDAAHTGNLAGRGGDDVFNLNANVIGNVDGGADNDTFNLLSAGLNISSIIGGAGTDEIVASNTATTFTITSNGAGTVNDGVSKNFNTVENLTGGNGNDIFNVNSAHTGTLSGGAGNDNFNISAVLTGNALGGTGDDTFTRIGGGNVNGQINGGADNDTYDVSAAAGSIMLTLGSGFINVENLIGSSDILVGRSGAANAWNLNGANSGTVNNATDGTVNFTGFNQVRSSSGGSNTFTANGSYNGQVNLLGLNNRWNHTAGATLTTGIVTGTGSLTIPGTSGADLTVGAGDLVLPNLAGLTGPVIIGGTVTAATTPLNGSQTVDVFTNILSVNSTITTGGDLVLLGSQINLNNPTMNVGNEVNLVAVGTGCNACQPGFTGNGNVEMNSPMTINANSGVIIAAGGIQNSNNLTLQFGGGNFQLAVSEAQQETSNPNPASNASGVELTQGIQDFINVLGLNVVGTVVTFFNPALQLFALDDVSFVDAGLFAEDLTLFGIIGEGIALSLAQCEEVEGCAPNVTTEELEILIQGLEARIEELERQIAETTNESERQELEALLAGFREELKNFEGYREELRQFLEGPIEGDDLGDGLDDELDFGDEEFDETPGAPRAPRAAPEDLGSVDTLAKMLSVINERIDFLESLRTDTDRRAELSERTGIELTPESLDRIIENTRKQVEFIESLIESLMEGSQTQSSDVFSADAGSPQSALPSIGYNSVDLMLRNGALPMDTRWF